MVKITTGLVHAHPVRGNSERHYTTPRQATEAKNAVFGVERLRGCVRGDWGGGWVRTQKTHRILRMGYCRLKM